MPQGSPAEKKFSFLLKLTKKKEEILIVDPGRHQSITLRIHLRKCVFGVLARSFKGPYLERGVLPTAYLESPAIRSSYLGRAEQTLWKDPW